MFYIETKRGFVRSITSSGLLNETVDARSAMSYPSRNSAIADAARSVILMSEYYMVLDAQYHIRVNRYLVEITYENGSVDFAVDENYNQVMTRTLADATVSQLSESYPKNRYRVLDI